MNKYELGREKMAMEQFSWVPSKARPSIKEANKCGDTTRAFHHATIVDYALRNPSNADDYRYPDFMYPDFDALLKLDTPIREHVAMVKERNANMAREPEDRECEIRLQGKMRSLEETVIFFKRQAGSIEDENVFVDGSEDEDEGESGDDDESDAEDEDDSDDGGVSIGRYL